MSQELKNRTKKFALDVIGLCASLPHIPDTRHAIDQFIPSSSSVAANYRSACRGKSKADFIAKLGIVEESDEAGFWLEMLRDIGSGTEIRHSKFDVRTPSQGNSTFVAQHLDFDSIPDHFEIRNLTFELRRSHFAIASGLRNAR